MIPIEEVEAILDEISEEFPQEFYKDLNGVEFTFSIQAKLTDK